MSYEYKVIPAPTRGLRAKGLKTHADRFANAVQNIMNIHANDGWEYLRTENLPSTKRKGIWGKRTTSQNLLIFCRAKDVSDFVETSPHASDKATPDNAPAVKAPDTTPPEKPPLPDKPLTATKTPDNTPAPKVKADETQDASDV